MSYTFILNKALKPLENFSLKPFETIFQMLKVVMLIQITVENKSSEMIG